MPLKPSNTRTPSRGFMTVKMLQDLKPCTALKTQEASKPSSSFPVCLHYPSAYLSLHCGHRNPSSFYQPTFFAFSLLSPLFLSANIFSISLRFPIIRLERIVAAEQRVCTFGKSHVAFIKCFFFLSISLPLQFTVCKYSTAPRNEFYGPNVSCP
ncbi:hypothetical protein FB451DRAFT_1245796 [Mycena latifolia]|nr:hypothetical protein FB451DRAFT_1245796 [Mycena latifolia]